MTSSLIGIRMPPAGVHFGCLSDCCRTLSSSARSTTEPVLIRTLLDKATSYQAHNVAVIGIAKNIESGRRFISMASQGAVRIPPSSTPVGVGLSLPRNRRWIFRAEGHEMPDNLFQRGKSVAINKVCKNMSFRRSPLSSETLWGSPQGLRSIVFQLSL